MITRRCPQITWLLRRRSITCKRLNERFLIGRDRSKRAIFFKKRLSRSGIDLGTFCAFNYHQDSCTCLWTPRTAMRRKSNQNITTVRSGPQGTTWMRVWAFSGSGRLLRGGRESQNGDDDVVCVCLCVCVCACVCVCVCVCIYLCLCLDNKVYDMQIFCSKLLSDIDECSLHISDCDQNCTNLPGSYDCDCFYGYRLNSDRATCSQG